MKTQRRRTRSDTFPLTLHPTGQYCKKINGKIYYFGTNKKQALKRYLDQATYLHGYPCAATKGSDGSMPLRQLCDLYLGYQHARVRAGAITGRHYADQVKSLNKLMSFLGKGRRIRTISTLDLQNYKRQLQNAHSTAQRPNSHIGTMKAMFHWARRNDILERIPNVDTISKDRIVHRQRYTFDSNEITKLLSRANVQMRAMIWLGLNCGFGCMDCAQLK